MVGAPNIAWLAQLVERDPYTVDVGGSNPSPGTKSKSFSSPSHTVGMNLSGGRFNSGSGTKVLDGCILYLNFYKKFVQLCKPMRESRRYICTRQ
jgi:hypothetical protein